MSRVGGVKIQTYLTFVFCKIANELEIRLMMKVSLAQRTFSREEPNKKCQSHGVIDVASKRKRVTKTSSDSLTSAAGLPPELIHSSSISLSSVVTM